MNRKRPLVFDLDGTLIDSREDIAAASNHALLAIGRDPLPIEQISRYVGNGARALLRGVLGEEAESVDLTEVLRHFQTYYLEHPTEHNRLMPGAEVCLRLRGERQVALCTNKPLHLTETVLASLGWTDRFDFVFGPRRGDALKPDAGPLLSVAKGLGVEPSELVMIGDGPQDVGAGKAVGAHTVGVKGGFLALSQLVAAGPDVLLESLEELPAYVELL